MSKELQTKCKTCLRSYYDSIWLLKITLFVGRGLSCFMLGHTFPNCMYIALDLFEGAQFDEEGTSEQHCDGCEGSPI